MIDIKKYKKFKLNQILQEIHELTQDHKQRYLFDVQRSEIVTFRPRYEPFDSIQTLCKWDLTKDSLGEQSEKTWIAIEQILIKHSGL